MKIFHAEFIEGLLILIIPLSIVGCFIAKWRKDYKETGKIIVLSDKKIAPWKIFISILFLIFSVYVISTAVYIATADDVVPIKILPEQYNPWGWYL